MTCEVRYLASSSAIRLRQLVVVDGGLEDGINPPYWITTGEGCTKIQGRRPTLSTGAVAARPSWCWQAWARGVVWRCVRQCLVEVDFFFCVILLFLLKGFCCLGSFHQILFRSSCQNDLVPLLQDDCSFLRNHQQVHTIDLPMVSPLSWSIAAENMKKKLRKREAREKGKVDIFLVSNYI